MGFWFYTCDLLDKVVNLPMNSFNFYFQLRDARCIRTLTFRFVLQGPFRRAQTLAPFSVHLKIQISTETATEASEGTIVKKHYLT